MRSLLAVLFAIVAGLGATVTRADDPTLPPDVIGTTWEWVSFITPKEQIDVEDPARYTLKLAPDGNATLRVDDCNIGVSVYALDVDNRISFSQIGTTMMLCEDDELGHRFTTELERVGTWFQQDGDFFLELPMDSGTLRFRPAPPPPAS